MRECPRCERCYDDQVANCPDDGSQTEQTLPGTTLLSRRYRLEKRIGRGAMGQVYLARDENLAKRRIAVKTFRPDVLSDKDFELMDRFEREARRAASIRHPNVVGVTDFGKSEEGLFFLVMEYVEGESLYRILRREGTISMQRTLTLLRQVCAGVEAAHNDGILHGDLKPANIFILSRKKKTGDQFAADDIIKVADFGLAKITSQSLAGSSPRSRGIADPKYVAPEQMRPDAESDERSDIYALGAIAYHLLGGRPPFTGNITQVMMQKFTREPPPLRTLRSDIPEPVESAIMHAIAREPDKRPASLAKWFDEFEKAASELFKNDRPGQSGKDLKSRGGGDVSGKDLTPRGGGEARTVVLGPTGSDVYVDDEKCGTIGPSGRLILTSIRPGRHVLRVAHGDYQDDDERVIELRSDGEEQIIQAQLKSSATSGSTPLTGSLGSESRVEPKTHGIVSCTKCGLQFVAFGGYFCPRCGNAGLETVNEAGPLETLSAAGVPPGSIYQPMWGATSGSPSFFKKIWRWIRPEPQAVPAASTRMTESQAPAAGRQGQPTQTAEPITTDEVSCSVFAPEYASRGQQLLVQVFAHLIEQAAQVREIAKEFDRLTERRGFQTLAEPVARGSTLAFELVLPGLEIDKPVQRMTWRASREPQAVSFGVHVPKDFSGEAIIGTVIASNNYVPLGHIKFKLSIGSHDTPRGGSPQNSTHSFVRYKRAFISYASPDRKEVLKRVQMLQLAGTEFFQDLLSLEPGERWERALYKEIDQSDVFYLFWSNAAKRSEWVMKEVQYAINRKNNDDSAAPAIVPVIIEGPPPVAPPPELSHLHFNHHIIYFMV